MKIILIARVSDVEQRKALPAQKLKLETYAKGKGYKSEYYEFDESAHGDTRVKFAELVRHIKAQKERCIVAFDKIDRFTRDSSQEEVKAINDLVRQGKIEVHFPSDNLFITKDSPASDLFRLGIGMALAKYYSDTIRDNVKRRFDQMLNDKIWIGASPIGYRNVNNGTQDKPDKDIVVDTVRAPHIIRMFEMRAVGLPYAHIAKYVSAQGLSTKAGNRISKSMAEKILKNPFYHGTMLYMGNLYPHKYEPLISRQLFNQCQAVREKRHGQHTAYASLEFALKDMVTCKLCGCTVTPYYSRSNIYLKCTNAKGGCINVNTAQRLVMPDVVATLGAIPFPSGAMPLIVEKLKALPSNNSNSLAESMSYYGV